jgi:hypothetical protein
MSTTRVNPAGTLVCPVLLTPQATTVPSRFRATANCPPLSTPAAATSATSASPAGRVRTWE